MTKYSALAWCLVVITGIDIIDSKTKPNETVLVIERDSGAPCIVPMTIADIKTTDVDALIKEYCVVNPFGD